MPYLNFDYFQNNVNNKFTLYFDIRPTKFNSQRKHIAVPEVD